MTRIQGHGLTLDLPPGWEARIYRRQPEPGATTHPIAHAATFALPEERGDFGSGAVDLMGPDDILVMLIEFPPDSVGTAAFPRRLAPLALSAKEFDPAALQRILPGQSGLQRFFTLKQRAFCLYVVLGSHARRDSLVPRAQEMLKGLVT